MQNNKELNFRKRNKVLQEQRNCISRNYAIRIMSNKTSRPNYLLSCAENLSRFVKTISRPPKTEFRKTEFILLPYTDPSTQKHVSSELFLPEH